jgi:oligopeptide transport system substrate-binding protein
MKRFRFLVCSVLVAPFLMNCGGDAVVDETSVDPNKIEKIEGGKFKGGVLRLNSIEEYTTLFPAAINDIYSTHIACQVYEGLFKFNQKTLEAEPCLAESFDIDNSKKQYTFHLRKGVIFHDDDCFAGGKGREITADDVKYCFEFLCSNHEENKWSTLFRDRLVGAVDYESGKSKSVEGIKVIDKHTIQLTLVDPFAGLPNLLAVFAASVYPEEAIKKYGYNGMKNHMVGTGPFIAEELNNGQNVRFVRNENYWAKDEFGNKLPYLAEVTYSFIKDKPEELKAFQDGNLDMVWGIPVEEIANIMGSFEEAMEGKNREFDLQSVNSLNIQYYGFLFTSETFDDVRVRKAFNYAIDRDSLVAFVLQGEGIPAHHGFVPPMSGYPHETVKGFDYNPGLAQKLIKEAGFPGGKGFPEITLHLNSSGGINEKIAEYIKGMILLNLGITINLNIIEMKDLHPKAERGELDFWRFGWIADYPDPSNFLYLFHGKNIDSSKETSINYFRYSNPAFDAAYEQALKEIDDEKRMKLYAQCDQILMDDAVVMPLLFNVDIRLINPEVKSFDINELEYRDLSVVYFELDNKSNIRVYDNLIPEDEKEAME